MAIARLIGELFAYELVDPPALLALLSQILDHGHKVPSMHQTHKPAAPNPVGAGSAAATAPGARGAAAVPPAVVDAAALAETAATQANMEIAEIEAAAAASATNADARQAHAAAMEAFRVKQEAAHEAALASEAVATAAAEAGAKAGESAEAAKKASEMLRDDVPRAEAAAAAALAEAQTAWAAVPYPPPPPPGALPLPWWSGADPRVECAADGNDDVFRLQLFLTLVEAVAEFFVAAGTLRRQLASLLVKAQRYLLAKHAVPLAVSKYALGGVLSGCESEFEEFAELQEDQV